MAVRAEAEFALSQMRRCWHLRPVDGRAVRTLSVSLDAGCMRTYNCGSMTSSESHVLFEQQVSSAHFAKLFCMFMLVCRVRTVCAAHELYADVPFRVEVFGAVRVCDAFAYRNVLSFSDGGVI